MLIFLHTRQLSLHILLNNRKFSSLSLDTRLYRLAVDCNEQLLLTPWALIFALINSSYFPDFITSNILVVKK